MHATCRFNVSRLPDEVVAYLSDPRNLVMANNRGRVVEQSVGPAAEVGSWSTMKFDQLLLRVEYTAFDPPDLVAVLMTSSGRGARGSRSACVYRLEPLASAAGTQVELDVKGSGGWAPAAVGRLFWPLAWRGIRARMEKNAPRSG
jgi:hypothetical protein